MYAPNNRASIFVRQKLIEMQEQFDEFTCYIWRCRFSTSIRNGWIQ